MSKIEKKKQKIKDQINFLEEELKTSLQKKVHGQSDLSVSSYTNKISLLRKQLLEIK